MRVVLIGVLKGRWSTTATYLDEPCVFVLQYDNEIGHYGPSAGMEGHSASMYDPHRSIQPHLSHSPGLGNHTSAITSGMHSQFPSYSTSSSSMPAVMNSTPVDSQVKRDKDLIYG